MGEQGDKGVTDFESAPTNVINAQALAHELERMKTHPDEPGASPPQAAPSEPPWKRVVSSLLAHRLSVPVAAGIAMGALILGMLLSYLALVRPGSMALAACRAQLVTITAAPDAALCPPAATIAPVPTNAAPSAGPGDNPAASAMSAPAKKKGKKAKMKRKAAEPAP